MKPIPKWLMIPPAVGLLLVLGPLTMQGQSQDANAAIRQPALRTSPMAVPNASPQEREALGAKTGTGSMLPATPDMWQITSALAGVLLLGGLGVYGLRRLRAGGRPLRNPKTRLITLRQSLRLGQRQAVHAIEFDDRILLIGDGERGLTLLESSALPDVTSDEQDATARAAAMLQSALVQNGQNGQGVEGDQEDGATPRNLIIPRPDQPTTTLPKRPVSPSGGAARGATGSQANSALESFRALLQKAGR
ncbi:MAG: flagellar biosynthetic protein FliO [bacterium]|nr:flagellar biosynthetic protein FliO [bacterium]